MMAKDKAPKVPVECVKTWSRLQTAQRGDGPKGPRYRSP